jgi:hypothetical protein
VVRVASTACRAAHRKVPAGKIAECIWISETAGTLAGVCPDCDRVIYRRVNPLKLDEVRGDLDVTVTQARPRIVEIENPNVNCDSIEGNRQ